MNAKSTPNRRRLVGLTVAAAASLATFAMNAAPATAATAAQGGRILDETAAGALPGSYVVVLNDKAIGKASPVTAMNALATQHRAKVSYRYLTSFRGFAATMSRAEALALSKSPSVAFVQQNKRVTVMGTQTPTPSWGLDRIDQRDLPLNNSYGYTNTGAGVTAYIVDTGIRTTHADFGGRAVWGTNTTGDGNNTDCNGHGTHVAGTVGGTGFGVAKSVRLVAVKVLNCAGSGTSAGVAAGLDWVTNNHTAGVPAVANMSLGGGADAVIDNALRTAIADGVTFAVASGNSNANACNYSPARVAEAITVNSTGRTDGRSSFSNFGSCTDIFAPGEGITSAWITNDGATNTISGTSMAAPHVAGAAALVLAATPAATPSQVWATLSANATLNKVLNPGVASPNRLLFTGGVTPPPNAGCAAVTNGTDVAIPDNTTVTSSITVAGCTGNASAASTVEVHIVHTYRGDLVVELVAPNGSTSVLSNRVGGSADNIDQVFTLNLSGLAANGVWTLRVRDAATADTGYINSWTLDL